MVDNTLGKIFTNTDVVTTSDSSKLIAGTKLLTTTVGAAYQVTAFVIRNLGGGSGIPFASQGLIINATVTMFSAPIGQAVKVDIKVGSTYATSSVVSTLTLSAGTTSSSTSLSINIQAGQFVFLDITQVGNIRPGSGLAVKLNYYTG